MAKQSALVDLNPEALCGVDAFRNLALHDRRAIAERCHARWYRTSQQIISHHDETRDVFFVISGQVRATIYSLSGKQVTFQDLGAGQMFGELSAIDGAPRSAHVVALSDALIVSTSPTDFWDMLRTYPPVAEVTLKRLTKLVRHLSERVFEISILPVKDRIHAELLHLARHHLRDNNTAAISPPPTHADIASRVGTHREAVTRVFNELKSAGLITRHERELIICDVAELARMVNEVLGN